jgi:hypothetical protein
MTVLWSTFSLCSPTMWLSKCGTISHMCSRSRQFVQRVEQLNSYIVQLPCWYYSLSAKPSTIPMNVAVAKAYLGSRVLGMCPLLWQDQFNLHEKGMAPVDIHLLLLSLKAIERLFTQERSNAQSNKEFSHKSKEGNMRPGTKYTGKVPKKVHTKKQRDLCKKHGDAHTTHNTRDCCKYKKDDTEKSKIRASRKGRKKPNPMKHSFLQLRKKMDRLEKVIKK